MKRDGESDSRLTTEKQDQSRREGEGERTNVKRETLPVTQDLSDVI